MFNQYLRAKKMHGYFELKYTKNKSFPFSKIEEHQLEGLQATENEGLVWKLSDEDRRKKPCDTLCLPPLPSYLVLAFERTLFCIRIAKVIELKVAGETSITKAEAWELAEKVIHI